MTNRRSGGAALVMLALAMALSSCSGSTDGGAARSASTSASAAPSPSSTAAPAPSPTVPPTAGPTTEPGPSQPAEDRQLVGQIGFPGLTCVLFRATDGMAYALTGPGVTPDVRTWAQGGRMPRTSYTDQPSMGPPLGTKVRVTGHVGQRLKSTCGVDVFVTSKVERVTPGA